MHMLRKLPWPSAWACKPCPSRPFPTTVPIRGASPLAADQLGYSWGFSGPLAVCFRWAKQRTNRANEVADWTSRTNGVQGMRADRGPRATPQRNKFTFLGLVSCPERRVLMCLASGEKSEAEKRLTSSHK